MDRNDGVGILLSSLESESTGTFYSTNIKVYVIIRKIMNDGSKSDCLFKAQDCVTETVLLFIFQQSSSSFGTSNHFCFPSSFSLMLSLHKYG